MTGPTSPVRLQEPQAVLSRLTAAAVFLVATINSGAEEIVRDLLTDLSALVRTVGFRVPSAGLTLVTGIGPDAWDRLFAGPRPAELHHFKELQGERHRAVSTPGDLLFHIRSARPDICFELAAQIMERLAGSVDREFAGSSYVIVQKYLHDLAAWNGLSVEAQEEAIGRRKLSNVELSDEAKPSNSHVALNTIFDPDGTQRQILRDNMAFGTIGQGEFGTYFIGYAATPTVIERMLENMFIGNPPGNHDRVLDFSKAVTGSLFFVPTADFLDAPPPPAGTPAHGRLAP